VLNGHLVDYMKVIEFRTDYRNYEGRDDSAPDLAQAELRRGAFRPTANANCTCEPATVRSQQQARPAARSIGAWLLLGFLRFYILFLSPVFGGACKFYPSCSNYAIEAVEKHGARRGFALAAKRLLRCRPFTQGGFDPVPDDLPHSRRPKLLVTKPLPSSAAESTIQRTERRIL
jgi:uncharacterized protein